MPRFCHVLHLQPAFRQKSANEHMTSRKLKPKDDARARKAAGTEALAQSMPSNATKAKEYGDAGVLRHASGGDAAPAFIAAVTKHRHFERQEDPPPV